MAGSLPLWAAFLGGAATMVVELAVGRILAPQVGSSIYTWSALIGLVMAGLSLGSWAGGTIADRAAPRASLGVALALAAAATLLVPPLATLPPLRWLPTGDVLARVVWQTALLVIPPSLLLGAIVPLAARLAVRQAATAGSRVGLVYAAGTLGSIGGTLATGFLLVDHLGSRPSIAAAGAALALLALVALGRDPGRLALVARTSITMGALVLAGTPGALQGPCTSESAYYCLQVEERGRLRALRLDKLLHSFNAPDDPIHLEYDYTRYFAEVARVHLAERQRQRALFVGGGGYTVPRHLEARYPAAEIDVIEIDPEVTRAAELYLGLRPDTRIRTFNEDARQFFIAGRTAGGYDLVFGDAFNDVSIPYQLTTVEMAHQVRASLAADGLYVANVIDLYPAGGFLRSYIATLRTVFPHVAILLDPRDTPSSPFSGGPTAGPNDRATFVVLASAAPLPLAKLAGTASSPGVVIDADRFEQLVGGGGLILTDDYAPVDMLTAPLFLTRSP